MVLTVYYDGECPFCTRYVRMLRLAKSAEVTLVDLRTCPATRDELQAEGFDVDSGMVVEVDGRKVGGADAVNTLALLSTPSDWVNRLNRALLSSPGLARILYPFLRMGRWVSLFLLGRELMADDDAGAQARRTIFSVLFALFSVFHFMNYAFEYGRFPPHVDQLAILASATLLFFRPGSSRALFLLMLVSTVSAVAQAPVNSNHTMVRNVALIGYWLSFCMATVRNRPASTVFTNFAPAGQGALLVMYFFGIFHKINSDFLNPATSCAVALWQQMPAPLAALEGPLVWYPAIYGTFVIEGGIMIALLTRRWRHVGIAAGIGFHLLLSLSSYAMYISFTMLSIALHSLFLSGEAAQRILASREMLFVRSRMRDPVYIVAAFLFVAGLAVLAFAGRYTLAASFALPLVLPFCAIILLYGRSHSPLVEGGKGARFVGAAVTALFFLNGAMPYLGLKTAQSINMFANLRLEAGVSNHLIFRQPPGPFHYLEKVAVIEDAGGDPALAWYREHRFGMVYYDLLAALAGKPDLRVTFRMDGHVYRDVGRDQLQADISATLHPSWVRKWFFFQPVALERPERCNV
jgi:predicted DCC family thiol-disulfide oxidoreductase YuxK